MFQVGDVVQFNENHKWRGSLGFISEIKSIENDEKYLIGCTCPDNENGCNAAYIYSMLSKNEFDYVGRATLMPKDDR